MKVMRTFSLSDSQFRFDSRTCHHMLAAFVVGSPHKSEGCFFFFPRVLHKIKKSLYMQRRYLCLQVVHVCET